MTILDRPQRFLLEHEDHGVVDEVWRTPSRNKWVHTESCVFDYAEAVGEVLKHYERTTHVHGLRPLVAEILIVGEATSGEWKLFLGKGVETETEVAETVEEETAAGAPSAALLLAACKDLQDWLTTTQDKLCAYLNISRSTVMAWKRDPAVHPRHARIPALLGLWAAIAGSKDELGEEATLRLIYADGRFGTPASLPVEELTELLLDASDESSLAALEATEYDPATAVPMTLEEIEAGERALSQALHRDLEGSGD